MQSSRYISTALSCGLLAIGLSPAAHADPLAVLNAARGQACGTGALAHAPALDAAARAVADGKSLRTAIEGSGYRAVMSALLRFDGVRNDSELATMVNRSCAQIAAPGLRDAGSYQRGQAFWIVIAEPFSVPKLDQTAAAARVLDLVNQARAQPRRCGNEQFGAAPALRASPLLARAASAHARDMAERGNMSHTGGDGSTPAQRVTRAGYSWSAVGENIAAGQRDADSVVKSWLGSPGHCANLMSPDYTETASGFATNASSQAGIYWAQVFAAPSASASR
jgi:uncharacterized protein YkwD